MTTEKMEETKNEVNEADINRVAELGTAILKSTMGYTFQEALLALESSKIFLELMLLSNESSDEIGIGMKDVMKVLGDINDVENKNR